MTEKIDYTFISDLEGGCKTSGYVPAAENSKSGVTIAVGFDLGQRNESDLKNLGLDDALIKQLKPYLGLKSTEATKKIKDSPLTISEADAQTIEKKVRAAHIISLKSKYNSASKNKKFFDLPKEAQTVIASVSFQYGPNLKTATPKFWTKVTTQKWADAVKLLKNFGDVYPTRRKKEAKVLDKIVVTEKKSTISNKETKK